jgi:hypothetical protein
MELFWKIIPFLILLWIFVILIIKYRNGVKEEVLKPSWLVQTKFVKYIGLVFFIRPNLRPWTGIWYFPLLFGFLGCFTIGDVITSTIYPPLPIEKMHTQEGVIKSISKRKKMDDLLVLEINNNKNREFAVFRDYGLFSGLNKKVKVWYSRGFSSIYTIDDIIYEVTINGKSIKKHPYDYKRYLEGDASSWNFTKYSFYTVVFSLLMIWIPNRKELPIHRLNRMRLYKKNKGVK